MQFFVTKTGLDAFDVARAWGLAVLLNVLTEDEVELQDVGWAFIVTPKKQIPENASLEGLSWQTLFSAPDVEWSQVFKTAKDANCVDTVRKVLEAKFKMVVKHYSDPTNFVKLVIGQQKKRQKKECQEKEWQTIYGSLEPAAFRGLRSSSKVTYGQEPQLQVRSEHAALAYLGMATCGRYWNAANNQSFVLIPIPEKARYSYFRNILETLEPVRVRRRNQWSVSYCGVQNAAAHYAVQLAERLRERAAAQESLQDRFSALLYFTLFGAGQQMKPSQGSKLNLTPLMQLIQHDPHGSEAVLRWLDFCFRLGATDGAEDLALAATELVMRWDLDAFERLVRVLLRLFAKNRIRYVNLPDEKMLREVMRYVSV